MADLICTRTPRLVAKPRDTRCHCLPCRVQASERPPPCSLCSPNIYPAQSLNLWKKGLVDSGVPLPPSSISPATAFPESQGGGICHSCHAPSLPPPSPLPEFAHQRVRYCCLRCLFIGFPCSSLQSATPLSRFASLPFFLYQIEEGGENKLKSQREDFLCIF